MKNPYIESRKRRAKLYQRNKRGDAFTDGIIVRYRYDNMTPDTLTFWDDALFIVNDYRVALWWTHPRYEYKTLVHEQAHRQVADLLPKGHPFANAAPNVTERGQPRKKSAQPFGQPTKDEYRLYAEMLSDMERRVGNEMAFEVRPSTKIAWYDWCKGLTLCAPFEVRSESDLLELSQIARRLVKHESTVADEFGGFVYDQADWWAECRSDEPAEKPK